MDNVINLFSVIIILLFWFCLLKKLMWNIIAPIKSVKAEIVDKYKYNIVSKHPGIFNSERYIVVFKTKDKKLLFVVSEFSYGNYKIKEKGILKYKGEKIISFQ